MNSVNVIKFNKNTIIGLSLNREIETARNTSNPSVKSELYSNKTLKSNNFI